MRRRTRVIDLLGAEGVEKLKKLSSVEDLLSDEEKEKLREDLAEISAKVHPCWDHC